MGTGLSPSLRGCQQPGPAAGSCPSECCLPTASCLQLTALLLPLALTFFSTTNSFSAAVRLLISSSYLWKVMDKMRLLQCSSSRTPGLVQKPPAPFGELPSRGKTQQALAAWPCSPALLLPSSSLCLGTYLVLYSSTYCRMFCSSDSSSPLCPTRDSSLLLRFWM